MFFRKPLVQDYQYYDFDSEKNLIRKDPIFTYWWDDIPNFGDWIGPFLLGQISNRPIINVKGNLHPNTLFSVGSVIEHIGSDFPEAKIWGSGLIQPLHRKRARKLNKYLKEIYAVRGEKTEYELSTKTDLKVPKIYGDPALLMPRFYSPQMASLVTRKVAVCPHFSHFDDFKHLEDSECLNIIDVRKPLLRVIDDIVNASICISTSLHGLIIAEAYGVPWVWLKISNKCLDGDNFKFEDFFTTLEGGDKIESTIIKEEDISEQILLDIARSGRLYLRKYSDEMLLNALVL
ncbi:polysaccharide pyruvyl transferase family protein [Acinetobacter pittii]|uniref:polysaccharide pyruvyl transferase family protein n=1 Tax=Acinetobacter pittii TaxID=48296 RepID=UPI000D336F09|nr:polysaccharide pyruvyl transferase family protein [Acinetobacter pittii]MCH2072358.1 polysaccharide pyruvyl transferase family protein [Acinetobacter pittii]PTV49725.1 hypothetical protein DBL01_04380 [Acinetobacter pittii]